MTDNAALFGIIAIVVIALVAVAYLAVKGGLRP